MSTWNGAPTEAVIYIDADDGDATQVGPLVLTLHKWKRSSWLKCAVYNRNVLKKMFNLSRSTH